MHSRVSLRVLCESLCVKGKFESINNKNVALRVNRRRRVVKVYLSMLWPTYAPRKFLSKGSLSSSPHLRLRDPLSSLSLFSSMLPSLNQALLGSLYNPDLTVSDSPATPIFLTSWTSQKRETSGTYSVTHSSSSSREVKTWRVWPLCMEAPLHLNQSAGGKKSRSHKGENRSSIYLHQPQYMKLKETRILSFKAFGIAK